LSDVTIDTAGLLETSVHRRRRFPILIGFCFAFVFVVAVCAAFGPLIAPKDPNAQELLIGVTPPNSEYWFGTDDLGRDVFSRTIVGARTAVIGPILIALGAMLIGNALGLFAGYRGGRVDWGIMRWVDLMYALPGLLVAVVVVGVLGGGYFLAVGLLVILTAPYDTRIVRGATLEQRGLPYVEAARTLGLSGRRITTRHIWPNVLPLVIANTFLTFAFSLVALSSLSFLGLGVGPDTPDWGRMLSESRTLLFDNPAAALAPAIMIVLTAASMNLIGDWLYEWLSDRGRAR
jgi:peptide/nickel transport system permease protein